ncbi:hypothetical protein [Chloroflexus sp.]|uniref:hypothetical protein n=1 Tax=Chloroflexus sp. TaxID=1904827 RepID=UPI00404A4C62
MTPKTNHKPIDAEGQATIQELLQEKLRLAIKLTMIQIKRSTLPKDSRATRLSQWDFLTRRGDFDGRDRRVARATHPQGIAQPDFRALLKAAGRTGQKYL